ncbi:MAG TPA: phospholipase D-like domain-containing protein, partial [Tepidisphaeraceae bacterium]|nr:phospholipase D-like domain-containing protein [Tepidisphaeraceae bacterium]
MDLVVPRTDQQQHGDAAAARPAREHSQRSAGMAAGINIAPGSDDDGWIVPDPVPLDDGTLVQLYKDGEALRAAYRAIEQARRRICLEVYIFADDDTGRAFAELLCRKAIQGVQVYVIYDSFGSLGTDRQMLRQMQRSGVHLEVFHPVYPWECRYSWRPFNRDHRKLLVIDDEIAGLGGLNVGHEYAGSWV